MGGVLYLPSGVKTIPSRAASGQKDDKYKVRYLHDLSTFKITGQPLSPEMFGI